MSLSFTRTRGISFVLWLFLLVATSWAQTPVGNEPILLRYKLTPGDVLALVAEVRQAGVAAGNIQQEIESDVTTLTRVRDAQGEEATIDDYTLRMRLLIKNNKQVVVDSEGGMDLQLGALDPRGKCETRQQNTRGEVLKTTEADDPEVLNQVIVELQRLATALPAQPVKIGDTWEEKQAPELAFGAASIATNWRFDRVEEVEGKTCAVLVGASVATLKDLEVPKKTLTQEINGQPTQVEIEEYIVELNAETTTTLFFDIGNGKPARLQVDTSMDVKATQKVVVAGRTVMEHGAPIGATRQGRTTITFREPTDDDLFNMIALAFTNCIRRKDVALLRSVVTDDFKLGEAADFNMLSQMLQAVFGQYATMDASYSNLAATTDKDTGTLTLMLSVRGAQQEGAALQPVQDVPLSLTLRREGKLWLASGAVPPAV